MFSDQGLTVLGILWTYTLSMVNIFFSFYLFMILTWSTSPLSFFTFFLPHCVYCYARNTNSDCEKLGKKCDSDQGTCVSKLHARSIYCTNTSSLVISSVYQETKHQYFFTLDTCSCAILWAWRSSTQNMSCFPRISAPGPVASRPRPPLPGTLLSSSLSWWCALGGVAFKRGLSAGVDLLAGYFQILTWVWRFFPVTNHSFKTARSWKILNKSSLTVFW